MARAMSWAEELLADEREIARVRSRLARLSVREGDHLLFTGAMSRGGYGKLDIFGRPRFAHRVALVLHLGDPLVGLVTDHLCRRPPCIEVAHLEAVTHAVNMQRGYGGSVTAAIQLARTECREGHPLSGENLMYKRIPGRNPVRYCRTCDNAYQRRKRAEKKSLGRGR